MSNRSGRDVWIRGALPLPEVGVGRVGASEPLQGSQLPANLRHQAPTAIQAGPHSATIPANLRRTISNSSVQQGQTLPANVRPFTQVPVVRNNVVQFDPNDWHPLHYFWNNPYQMGPGSEIYMQHVAGMLLALIVISNNGSWMTAQVLGAVDPTMAPVTAEGTTLVGYFVTNIPVPSRFFATLLPTTE